jgi:DNA primase
MPRGGGASQKPGERQMLFEILSAAGAFFSRSLEHPQQGQAARDYLLQRGINGDSVRKFQIGYAPDAWDGLLRGPIGRKYSAELLILAGMIKKRETGGFYDSFRNRLMFPIRDDSGRVIAFGGREMPGANAPPKYLNSAETPVFVKSRNLFGLDLAKQKIVETRTAIVVEGYTDVVMAHQFGASNVVSPLGTAVNEQHVGVLRRLADRIVFLFDADSAGDAAVDRAVGLFLTQEIDIAVAAMPQGQDPDEFLLANGVDAFNKVISASSDALLYKWKQLLHRFNASGDSLTGQQKAVEEYLGVLAAARGSGPVDSIRWGRALAQVSRLTEISADDLNQRFRSTRKAPRPTDTRATVQEPAPAQSVEPALPVGRRLSARETAERRLLGVLLLEPSRWHDVQKKVALEDFVDELHLRLAQTYWGHQQDEGEPVFNECLGLLEDENLRELAILAIQEIEGLAEAQILLDEAISFFQEARHGAEQRRLLAEVQRKDKEADGMN